MFSRLAALPRWRWLAYAIEVGTPVAVALCLTWTVMLTFQHADDLAREARTAQVRACGAVKDSNDALELFLRGRVRANPKSDTPKAESFLHDLHAAYVKAEKVCLIKP